MRKASSNANNNGRVIRDMFGDFWTVGADADGIPKFIRTEPTAELPSAVWTETEKDQQ